MLKVISIHWGLSLGGVAKYAATLEKLSDIKPIKINSVCILPHGRVVDEQVLECLDATIIPINSRLDFSWLTELKREIDHDNPDLILSHGFNGHLVSLLGRMISRKNAKRVASYHGSYHATTNARKLVEPIYNGFTLWFMRYKASSILCVAQYCADFLVQRKVPKEKVAVVHNGIPDLIVDAEARERIRNEWDIGSKQILIGVASRLDPVKGLEFLIEAFANIASKHPEVRLVLMGDGAMRKALEKQVHQLSIEGQVHFTGLRSDIPECLSALDVFALPSLAEYHSIGLLEAMRAGLAIVATDVGGNTESVRNGLEGEIVQPADVVGLQKSIEKLVTDEEMRNNYSQAARNRFLEEFSEDYMLKQTAEWLSSASIG